MGPCGLVKDLSEFTLRKEAKDGHRNVCKTCTNKRVKNWKANPSVKEIVPDGFKRCRGECKQIKSISEFGRSNVNKDGLKSYCRDCKSKLDTIYRKEHPETSLQYRHNHKEELRIRKHNWYLNNKDKAHEDKTRRRARVAGVNETYGRNERVITMAAFDHNCYNCNSEDKLCIDHHRPLVKGNALTLDNAVVLCRTCNSRKSDKDPEEFYGTERCAELDKKLAKILEEHKEEIPKVPTQDVSALTDKPLEIK